MNRKVIIPKDEQEWLALRTKDITSTDVAALFGISPYLTEFELWHRKKSGMAGDFQVNERMTWGTRLQDAIAVGIAVDHKLEVDKMIDYMRIPELRMGSSFDYFEGANGILEVKNVDSLAYKDGWIVDGANVEAPAHIELQVQHQMLVSGRTQAAIGALIGGNRVVIIRRKPDLAVAHAIKSKVAKFWESIDANQPPEPNFKEDAAFISRLNGYAEPGKVVNATGDNIIAGLVRDYKEWSAKSESAKNEKDAIKARLLTLIGDAEKVTGDGWSISARTLPSTWVEAYERKGYRDFRVNLKKEKANV